MEANKAEAAKCLNIARKSLREENIDKATRFADKAKRLGGEAVEDQVAQLVREIQAAKQGGSKRSNASNGSGSKPSGASAGTRSRTSGRASSSREEVDEGTPEQRALVKRINGCEDYYAILGISDKSCSEDTIKRSYKKLALKLHPDKCKVRGAEDAFKAVSRAFSCLSDPQKRSSYDRFGSEQPGFGGGGGGGAPSGFYRHNAQEIDPEELFNMFFGGSPVFGHTRFHTTRRGFNTRRSGGQGGPQEQGFNLAAIIQLLPVLFLVLFTLIGNSPSEPVYSLQMQGKYNARETTAMRGIDYYVKSHSKFDREYPKGTYARRRVDVAVEKDYRQFLENECWRERLRYRGNSGGKKEVHLKSCMKLSEIWG